MMADENNDGVNPQKAPQTDVATLMKKYPAAAAYLEAEEYSLSENYTQASIGDKALKRMQFGEDCLQVQKDMQDEWSNYCAENID